MFTFQTGALLVCLAIIFALLYALIWQRIEINEHKAENSRLLNTLGYARQCLKESQRVRYALKKEVDNQRDVTWR